MEIFIVAEQTPSDFIVGLYEKEVDAVKEFESLHDASCPLIYPCDIEMVEFQSGYHKNLSGTLNKLRTTAKGRNYMSYYFYIAGSVCFIIGSVIGLLSK